MSTYTRHLRAIRINRVRQNFFPRKAMTNLTHPKNYTVTVRMYMRYLFDLLQVKGNRKIWTAFVRYCRVQILGDDCHVVTYRMIR